MNYLIIASFNSIIYQQRRNLSLSSNEMPDYVGIENVLSQKLRNASTIVDGQALLDFYLSEKTRLREVYASIPLAIPNYTEHGEKHVKTVLIKTERLLNHDGNPGHDYFNAAELFILCLAIIYHDTGMVFNRTGHQLRVREVLQRLGSRSRPEQETACFCSVISGHTGITDDGTQDVISKLPVENFCHNNTIRIRELSAVLRFADELAEGHQRIVPFSLDSHVIKTEHVLHHIICEGIETHPNPGQKKVNITHSVSLDRLIDYSKQRGEARDSVIDMYLKLLYYKTSKINTNRLYTRYYTSILEPFKRLEAIIKFCKGHYELNIQLDPLVFDDKITVRQHEVDVCSVFPQYNTCSMVPELLTKYDGDDFKTHTLGV